MSLITRRCRSCAAEIMWATEGTTNKLMPIHKASLHDPAGNLQVWKDIEGKVRWQYVMKDGLVTLPGHFRAMSHYAFCPDAEAWRAKNRK